MLTTCLTLNPLWVEDKPVDEENELEQRDVVFSVVWEFGVGGGGGRTTGN